MAADDIWTGGRVETLDPGRPMAQAFAVKGGRFLAVGSDGDILNLAGSGTRCHALHGRYVMPGLVESHTHALWGACRDLFDVYVGYQAEFYQLLEAVRTRADKLPEGGMVFGGPWRLDMRGQMGPRPREVLDSIAPAHPVALQDVTQHSLWCNSLALKMAGITRTSGDVPGGVVERDPATGEPTGILAETACAPVKQLHSRTPAQLAEAVDHFVRYFHGLGFTAFKEPMAFEADLAAYRDADLRGDLRLHMAAHIVKSSPFSSDPVPYDEVERLRDTYASPNLRTGFAKLFLDGVAPSFTASFLQPYLASAGYDVAGHDPAASLLIQADTLNDTVTELDRRGFVTKMHAVGDNAVRAGLNAIAAARQRNGDSGLRHEVAHCPFIHPDDVSRFASLNAIAEMSPKLWYPNPATAAQIAVLGRDRVEHCHPFRDLLAAGAELTYASDWPAAAPDANPWTGLAGMISRRNTGGDFPGTLGADQAIDLAQALPIFTRNGARALGMGDEAGTIRAGNWADFIVLDRPLPDLTAEEIGAVEVRETHWKGRMVHQR